ncbi:uncharacterized protein V1518DRAFT_143110 [Limtongia smithiae]|uniref:uncharacterized protein n=1 Tax=Limtongia smithiae TaxID=1125753 RepID=UPI0034CE3E5F
MATFMTTSLHAAASMTSIAITTASPAKHPEYAATEACEFCRLPYYSSTILASICDCSLDLYFAGEQPITTASKAVSKNDKLQQDDGKICDFCQRPFYGYNDMIVRCNCTLDVFFSELPPALEDSTSLTNEVLYMDTHEVARMCEFCQLPFHTFDDMSSVCKCTLDAFFQELPPSPEPSTSLPTKRYQYHLTQQQVAAESCEHCGFPFWVPDGETSVCDCSIRVFGIGYQRCQRKVSWRWVVAYNLMANVWSLVFLAFVYSVY